MLPTDHRPLPHLMQLLPLLLLTLLLPCRMMAQEQETDTAKVEYVYLLHADITRFDKHRDPDAQLLEGHVAFRHDSLYMECDTAYFYESTNSLRAHGHVHMYQGDTLTLDGDRLYYDGNARLAEVRGNVRMEDPKMVLTTDSLNYDRTLNLGYYFEWGTLQDSVNTLTSQWGEYDTQSKDALFQFEVTLTNENFVLTSDTLGYNTTTTVATITGPSHIDSDENHIYTTLGYYDTGNDRCDLFERSVLNNDDNRLIGDSMHYDRKLGYGEAFSNVVLNDFKDECRLTGDYIYYNELCDSAYATGRAIATDYSQGDSLFIHGDTLRMTTHYKVNLPDSTATAKSQPAKASKGKAVTASDSTAMATASDSTFTAADSTTMASDSSNAINDTLTQQLPAAVQQATIDTTAIYGFRNPALPKDSIAAPGATAAHPATIEQLQDSLITYRIITAARKVRVYRSDVQAVCDSLVFNTLDSCLTMYFDPIIWNGKQQILGEKIMVYMNDSTINWVHIENQALIVEQLDTIHYNQIGGRNIKAYFEEGEIEHTDVEGNVEVIYYYREEGDSLFVGMNSTEASMLTAYMENRTVEKLFISNSSKGVFYPILLIPQDKLRLKTFAWFAHIRPTGPNDLLSWRGKTSEQKLKKSSRATIPLPSLKELKESTAAKAAGNKPKAANSATATEASTQSAAESAASTASTQ